MSTEQVWWYMGTSPAAYASLWCFLGQKELNYVVMCVLPRGLFCNFINSISCQMIQQVVSNVRICCGPSVVPVLHYGRPNCIIEHANDICRIDNIV